MKKHNDQTSEPDRMFDGHLERPIEQLTPAERLRRAWQGTMTLYWAQQVRKRSGKDPDPLRDERRSPVD